jgi:hypothetical protein
MSVWNVRSTSTHETFTCVYLLVINTITRFYLVSPLNTQLGQFIIFQTREELKNIILQNAYGLIMVYNLIRHSKLIKSFGFMICRQWLNNRIDLEITCPSYNFFTLGLQYESFLHNAALLITSYSIWRRVLPTLQNKHYTAQWDIFTKHFRWSRCLTSENYRT